VEREGRVEVATVEGINCAGEAARRSASRSRRVAFVSEPEVGEGAVAA